MQMTDALLDGPKAAWEEKMSKRFSVVDTSSASGNSGEGNAMNKPTTAGTM